MLRPYDLTQLADAARGCPKERRAHLVPAFEQVLSGRDRRLRYAAEEVAGLIALVEGCRSQGVADEALCGFVYSYSIPHISKELDVLKVAEGGILDIELKSQPMPGERIGAQLTQNEYFLRFLGLPVTALTYCSGDDSWHTVEEGAVRDVAWEELPLILERHQAFADVDLDELFVPRNFLVSPVQDPRAFLEGRYFLTGQQEMARSRALSLARAGCGGGLVVSAETGTGKTLLLYDVARSVAETDLRPAAIVCGSVPSALHVAFDACCQELELFGPEALAQVCEQAGRGAYSFVGVDEAQLLDARVVDVALRLLDAARVPYLVALDPGQGAPGAAAQVFEAASCHVGPDERVTLTRRLRCNPRVADYVAALTEGRAQRYVARDVVDVYFAATAAEAERTLARLEQVGYHVLADTGATAHAGLEYDRVAMRVAGVRAAPRGLMNADDAGRSRVRALSQGLLRAREAIALVVEGAWEVFERAVRLLESEPG